MRLKWASFCYATQVDGNPASMLFQQDHVQVAERLNQSKPVQNGRENLGA